MSTQPRFAEIADLIPSWSALWKPPERLPLSLWAERNIVLSSEFSAKTGPLRLWPWQRDIFDSFTDPRVQTIVVMSGTQLVKTLFIMSAIAYSIAEQPGPMLVVEPSENDAKAFSTERLAPMVRNCEAIHHLVADPKSRVSSNTMYEKEFPGGRVSIVGSNAPGNLARRTIRNLFCDEVDKYPLSAGAEGDPLMLATERTVHFQSRRKHVYTCSPTVSGTSRISKAYAGSDQRKPWAPCSSCGKFQILKWGQVKWNSNLPLEERPETARYECLHCKALWNDSERMEAADRVVWRADRPFAGIAGFWISHLYSPVKKLSTMVEKWLSVQSDRYQLQVFINTNLAELWEEEGETPDHEILFGRREQYPFSSDSEPDAAVVPRRGLFLTAAVDVQDNPARLEVEIVAWGRDRENWSVGYRVLQVLAENGQPLPVTSPELWAKLDQEVLQREYKHESGVTMPIMLMAIDTGNRPKPVYDFALKHPQPAYSPAGLRVAAPRSVVPIKGTDDGLRIISNVSKTDAARKRQGVRIVSIGTACVKQQIYDALQHIRPRADGEAVPGCYHHPQYEASYFEGVCSEKRVVKENGKVDWEKLPSVRNEPLDVKVYNRGAAAIFGIDRFNEAAWLKLEEMIPSSGKPIEPASPVAAKDTGNDLGFMPRRREGWLGTRGRDWFRR